MTYTLKLSSTSGVPADGNTPNTATATLMNDEVLVSGETVTFLLSGKAAFAGGKQIKNVATDALGEATVSFTDTLAETVTVTALVNSQELEETATSEFSDGQSGSGDDYILTLKAASGAAPDGISTNDVTVNLTDRQGQPLARRIVDVTVSGSARFTDGTAAATVITDKNGAHVAKITDTAEEKVSLTAVLYDDDGTTVLAQADTTSGFGQADSDYKLHLAVSSGARPDGIDSNIITVTLTDGDNIPLRRQIVDLEVDKNAAFTDGGGQSLQVVTDSEGRHQASITDRIEEVVTVTATLLDDDGSVLVKAQDTCGFGQAASKYVVTLTAASDAPADGSTENAVVVSVKHKEDGTPVYLGVVQVKAGGSATFSHSGQHTDQGVTNEAGEARFGLTNMVEESVHLMAVFMPPADDNVIVEGDTHFGPAQKYTLLVSAEDGAKADGTATNAVKVELKDEDGAPVKGADITLSVDGNALLTNGKGSIIVTTNGQGLASDALTDETAETVKITAVYNDGNVTGSAGSTFSQVPKHQYRAEMFLPEEVPLDRFSDRAMYIQAHDEDDNYGDFIKHLNIWSHDADMHSLPGYRYGNHYEGGPNDGSMFTATLYGTRAGRNNPVTATVTFIDGTTQTLNGSVDIIREEAHWEDSMTVSSEGYGEKFIEGFRSFIFELGGKFTIRFKKGEVASYYEGGPNGDDLTYVWDSEAKTYVERTPEMSLVAEIENTINDDDYRYAHYTSNLAGHEDPARHYYSRYAYGKVDGSGTTPSTIYISKGWVGPNSIGVEQYEDSVHMPSGD